MSQLKDVRCTYTGGGVYVVTAKFGDVYIMSDLDTYGTYDIPYEKIEEHDCSYDEHWKKCSEPLPTWRLLLNAIILSHFSGHSRNMDVDEVKSILQKHHPNLDVRMDDVQFPMPTDKRLETIAPIIEIFEEFLKDKGIVIENDEKKESESPSNIYGTDWGNLCDSIEAYLVELGVLEEEK